MAYRRRVRRVPPRPAYRQPRRAYFPRARRFPRLPRPVQIRRGLQIEKKHVIHEDDDPFGPGAAQEALLLVTDGITAGAASTQRIGDRIFPKYMIVHLVIPHSAVFQVVRVLIGRARQATNFAWATHMNGAANIDAIPVPASWQAISIDYDRLINTSLEPKSVRTKLRYKKPIIYNGAATVSGGIWIYMKANVADANVSWLANTLFTFTDA